MYTTYHTHSLTQITYNTQTTLHYTNNSSTWSSQCNFPKHFTRNRTTDQVRKQMDNTDEHAQIPNTQHSPTHNTPYHNRRTNNPIHKQSNSIRHHILNTKHNTTNYNTQSHGHEDTKQITKIQKPIHKQQKKTVQNNYTPTATIHHSTKHYFTLIIQKTTTGTKPPTNIRLTNNSLTINEPLIGPPSLELRARALFLGRWVYLGWPTPCCPLDIFIMCYCSTIYDSLPN